MKVIIIKRPEENEGEGEETTPKHNGQMTKSSDKVMTVDFFNYVSKNGYHFTESLAEDMSKDLKDADKHTWSCEQIKEEIGSALIDLMSPITIGDVTYYSNFIYSKFYPHTILRDKDCAKAAYRILKDYKYPEASFNHFISDAIGEGKEIDWIKY